MNKPRTIVLALGAMLWVAPLQADVPEQAGETFRNRTFNGAFTRDGSKMSNHWSAWVDVPVDLVRARLMVWPRSGKLIKDALSVDVKKTHVDGARFAVERQTPGWMPNFTVVFDAKMVTHPDGGELMWTQVEGPATTLDRSWRFRAEGSGTRVTSKTKVELPFSPPSFLTDQDPATELRKDVYRFRDVVKAKQVLSIAPRAPTPPAPPTLAPALLR